MLNNDYKLSNFILYGFSQGAIGSAIAAKFYNDQLRTKGIKIEKMILDSPVSNVKKKLKDDARKRKVPKFILGKILSTAYCVPFCNAAGTDKASSAAAGANATAANPAPATFPPHLISSLTCCMASLFVTIILCPAYVRFCALSHSPFLSIQSIK